MSCFCLFFFTQDGWWIYAVSLWSGAGQQGGHQKPAEVCDGECSWCLSLGAGQSYRQGLSCPTIKTHRGRQSLQRLDKYTLSHTQTNTHTHEHTGKQAHEQKQQWPLKIVSSTKMSCSRQIMTSCWVSPHCFSFFHLISPKTFFFSFLESNTASLQIHLYNAFVWICGNIFIYSKVVLNPQS